MSLGFAIQLQAQCPRNHFLAIIEGLSTWKVEKADSQGCELRPLGSDMKAFGESVLKRDFKIVNYWYVPTGSVKFGELKDED